MTTQVSFKIDKKLKERAMKKARSKGLALTSVLTFAAKAFVEGHFSIEPMKKEQFNEATRKEIRTALKDIAKGKNLSPPFHSAKEVAQFLSK